MQIWNQFTSITPARPWLTLVVLGCLTLSSCGGGSGGGGTPLGGTPLGGTPLGGTPLGGNPSDRSSMAGLSSSESQAPEEPSSAQSSISSLAASMGSASSINLAAGLDKRPVNSTCFAPAPVADDAPLSISWVEPFPQLPNMEGLVGLAQAPGDEAHWFGLRQAGLMVRFDNSADASEVTTLLDLRDRVEFSGGETGLLGIAFHPDFASNRYLFLNYTALDANGKLETRVSRFQFAADGSLSKESELLLLHFAQPFNNHNGGQLAFGPDGYLYIATGDGGSAGDPHENGQNTNSLLGKMLRIDINQQSAGRAYGIPADNPFVQGGGAPEIWAYGLRNPWRFSFNRSTGALWAGDVGQGAYEEINIVTNGGNFGWGDMEGNGCYSERPQCSTAGKIRPVHVINHTTGACSVIGGYAYHGSANPAAAGRYFFSDFCDTRVYSLAADGAGGYEVAEHSRLPINIVAFAEDHQGELYAVGQSGAGRQIQKMQTSGGGRAPGRMAAKLSETGCVVTGNPRQPAAGLIPYDVQSPLWSDGAAKARFMALPDNRQVELAADGDFLFPVGTVLVKHFKTANRFIETRLFAHGELGWQGFSYEWLADQSDALLLNAAKDVQVDSLLWHFPSSGECMTCHTSAAQFALGPETAQVGGNLTYQQTGRTANQLVTLAHIGVFAEAPSEPQLTTVMADPADPNADLTERVRAYLHSNCSNCHRAEGPTPVALDLRYGTPLNASSACDQVPATGDLDIADARIIAPGDPARSVLLQRMKRRDDLQMPPLATHEVDSEAVALIENWIAQMAGCN